MRPHGALSVPARQACRTLQRLVDTGFHLQRMSSMPTRPLHAFIPALALTAALAHSASGYSAGRISGDGLSTLLYQDTVAGGQPASFAIAGPSGTQVVAPPAGWNNTAVSLSYNGSVAGGISTTPGPNAASTLHMLRWAGGP